MLECMAKKNNVKVLVSGCFDILHAGHVQFFEDAKALGDHLTVCFASDEVLRMYKGRISSIPEDNKEFLIGSLKVVDEVVKSSNLDPTFDFIEHVKKIKPDILAITEDDKHIEEKQNFCKTHDMKLVILPKRNNFSQVSTTSILKKITGTEKLPLRVDFAGGWLDVPKYSKNGAFVVNCTISPLVSLEDWPYEQGSGLGGSAAIEMLKVKNGLVSELNKGVGWQDPAVIKETGLCVWRSGLMPILEAKYNPDWLIGKMLIRWTGKSHSTPQIAGISRDYELIEKAGKTANEAVKAKNIQGLAQAIQMSYHVQLGEKMEQLPNIPSALANKYLGGGHGGYALYIFNSQKQRDKIAKTDKSTKIVEPYIFSQTL